MVTEPIALDKSLNTTDQISKNIADVVQKGLNDIKNAIGSSGGSGHTIVDQTGQDMPQENEMQFADAFLTDDSVNGRTVVENIKEVSPADYASTTDEGIIVTDDGDDALIGPVSDDYVEVTADGTKTYTTLLNELYAQIDSTKINFESYIVFSGLFFAISDITISRIRFTRGRVDTSDTEIYTLYVQTSDSKYLQAISNTTGNSFANLSSGKPTNGTKITLYYGNKTAVVDLQTTANRCLMSDGETSVEDMLTAEPTEDKVEVTADGVKTYGQLLNELKTNIDASKLTNNAVLKEINGDDCNIYNYCYQYGTSSAIQFSRASYHNSGATTVVMSLVSGSYYLCIGTNLENRTSNTAPVGMKFILYYGNEKATVNLQTTANRCLLNSGQTVESALTPLLGSLVGGSLNDLKETFIGFGYNVTCAPDGNYGFLFCIKSIVDGSVAVNQNWCKNDSTTWHTRIFRNGSWGNWS